MTFKYLLPFKILHNKCHCPNILTGILNNNIKKEYIMKVFSYKHYRGIFRKCIFIVLFVKKYFVKRYFQKIHFCYIICKKDILLKGNFVK
jgi:hypothetical protein